SSAAAPGVPFMDGKTRRLKFRRRGNTVVQAALVGTATLACLGAVGLMVGVFDFDGYAQEHKTGAGDGDVFAKLSLFQGWQKPDVAILLSGEQHGYLQPCGCSTPQYGGLTRRYNLLEMMRQRGWPVTAFDLGDIPAMPNSQSVVDIRPQRMLKYRYSMMALQAMNYGAVGVGQLEMNMPLLDAMGEHLNNPDWPKVLSANLIRVGAGAPYQATVFDFVPMQPPKQKSQTPVVGVVGIAGKEL